MHAGVVPSCIPASGGATDGSVRAQALGEGPMHLAGLVCARACSCGACLDAGRNWCRRGDTGAGYCDRETKSGEALERFAARNPTSCECRWEKGAGGVPSRVCAESCCCDVFGCHSSKCTECAQCIREGYRWCNGRWPPRPGWACHYRLRVGLMGRHSELLGSVNSWVRGLFGLTGCPQVLAMLRFA